MLIPFCLRLQPSADPHFVFFTVSSCFIFNVGCQIGTPHIIIGCIASFNTALFLLQGPEVLGRSRANFTLVTPTPNVPCSSNVTPKYLSVLDRSRSCSSILKHVSLGHPLIFSRTASLFSGAIFRPCSSIQFFTNSTLLFSFCVNPVTSLSATTKAKLFAKPTILTPSGSGILSTPSYRTFNDVGPKMEPWGTPALISILFFPLITYRWLK